MRGIINWIGALILVLIFIGIASVIMANSFKGINKAVNPVNEELQKANFVLSENPNRYILVIGNEILPYGINENPLPYARVSYLFAHDTLGLLKMDLLVPKEYQGKDFVNLVEYGQLRQISPANADLKCCIIPTNYGNILVQSNNAYCSKVGGYTVNYRSCILYLAMQDEIDELIIILDSQFPYNCGDTLIYAPENTLGDLGYNTCKYDTNPGFVYYYGCYFSGGIGLTNYIKAKTVYTFLRSSTDRVAIGKCYKISIVKG